jgi:pimeloyl-ACP methyl ester carboxylesterase
MPERLTLSGHGVTLAADRWRPDSNDGSGSEGFGNDGSGSEGFGGEGFGTVLLLHGGGQTRHSWQHTGRRLARGGWTAITLDTRGHGESDWAPDGDYRVDALAADLRAVIGTVERPPVLVGASLGGLTSLIVAGEHPGLARGLMLVDVTPRLELDGALEITDFMRSGTEGFATLEDAAAAVHAYNPHRERPPRPEGLRKNMREISGRWYWHWDPAFLGAAQRPGWENGRGAAQEMRSWETRARAAAAAVTVPTMLVRGVQSRVVSEAGADELCELIPAARRLDVAGAGHMVAGDDNDVFSAGLLDWLERDVLLAG